ncbi:MAG: cytochrome c [Acidobacteriota bacterium]|nr:cytochrome c [Acidobacteriota bacterium]MDQ7087953.1 cytochrome c [Acidobacteriota bacterium]
MPRPMVYLLILLVCLSFVPLAWIARARTRVSSQPRIHIVPDMDSQEKFKAQSASLLFSDGRAMRLPVDGTIAQGELQEDDHYYRGKVGEAFATTFPGQVRVDRALLERGRERYGIYCAPCHGQAGDGDGMVARRAEELGEGTWTPPSNLHDQTVVERPVGHIYNTIANGIRNMPAYGSQVPVADRWAIVAYVRALQRSRRASIDEVPADKRSTLR